MANMSADAGKFDELKKYIDSLQGEKGVLMPIMQHAQEIFGYLPIEVQSFISDQLDVPMTDVYGVATFYAQFAIEAKGEHIIGVCLGTACYVKGSQAILDEQEKLLGIKTGSTTLDGKFTLEATRCLGCCGLAPVMMIDDQVYGRLTASAIKGILDKYKQA